MNLQVWIFNFMAPLLNDVPCMAIVYEDFDFSVFHNFQTAHKTSFIQHVPETTNGQPMTTNVQPMATKLQPMTTNWQPMTSGGF